MPWIYLLLAALCEVVWATGMKLTGGFAMRPWLSLGTFAVSIASFILLALAMRSLPMGTSYAVWTGLGVVGVAIVGIAWFGEPTAPARLFCMALIILGILGLKLTAG
jgi:quaternary ammonium compound-resistance protein SugE